MREDEIALKCGDIGTVDLNRSEFSEAGIDAVDGRIAGGDLCYARRRLVYAGIKCGIEFVPVRRSSKFFPAVSAKRNLGGE